jgi:hypothetical protein
MAPLNQLRTPRVEPCTRRAPHLDSSAHARRCRAYTNFEALQPDAVLVEDALASLRCCTGLQLGSSLLQQLGALKWAWQEARQQVSESASSSASSTPTESAAASSSSQQPYAAVPPNHLVLWLPEWLAAAPSKSGVGGGPVVCSTLQRHHQPKHPLCLVSMPSAYCTQTCRI